MAAPVAPRWKACSCAILAAGVLADLGDETQRALLGEVLDGRLLVALAHDEATEALDRDVKKPHENPAIGVLLCASKDDEVVEYALSRTASPALIAAYATQLPDKALLQSKLHEFYLQDAGNAADAEVNS